MRAAPDDIAQLVLELEALESSYDQEQAALVLETRRRMAELDELQIANRLITVGTLTIGMAHELGTPLGVILARAQMIVTDDPELGEARADAIEIIRQVNAMTLMCQEVLDYARPKSPIKVAVDLLQITRQVIGVLLFDARKRSAQLAVAGTPTLVLGDASKLMQILTNLIINAAQAMPRGGDVTIAIGTRRVQPPAVHGLPEADYACVEVRDTGTGILGADLPHIFDTFYTTKRAGEGSGLGLAVSSQLAREHAGWIGVDTAEGGGSTFTLYLPPLA